MQLFASSNFSVKCGVNFLIPRIIVWGVE